MEINQRGISWFLIKPWEVRAHSSRLYCSGKAGGREIVRA
jgi:hypothetical protein